MRWRILAILLVTLGFCGTMRAQDSPFLGIWRLTGENTPNEVHYIVNLPAPGGFTSLRINVNKDNRTSTEVHPVAFDGKPYPTTGGDAREISYKLINARLIERTQNRNGNISMDTEEVSSDGKTLSVKQAAGTRVYNRQFSVQELKN
jgi:hypothetical protein